MFLISVLLLLPLRLAQLFFWPQALLGISADSTLSVVLLLSGLLVAAFLLILMSAKSKNAPNAYAPVKNIFAALAAVLAGVAIILNSITLFYDTAVRKVPVTSGTFAAGHPSVYIVLAVTGLAAAMMFFLYAAGFATGGNAFHSLPLLALLLPLWYCYNLVIQFISNVSSAGLAENALEVLTLVFTLLFLFQQAKLMAGFEPVKTLRRCYVYGLPAALLSLLSALPACVAQLLRVEMKSSFTLYLHLVNLAIAVHILAFLLVVCRQRAATPPAPAPGEEPSPMGGFFDYPATPPDPVSKPSADAPVRTKPAAAPRETALPAGPQARPAIGDKAAPSGKPEDLRFASYAWTGPRTEPEGPAQKPGSAAPEAPPAAMPARVPASEQRAPMPPLPAKQPGATRTAIPDTAQSAPRADMPPVPMPKDASAPESSPSAQPTPAKAARPAAKDPRRSSSLDRIDRVYEELLRERGQTKPHGPK